MDTLTGCRAKLARAHVLMTELGDQLLAYLMRDPFLPVAEPLPGGNEVIIRLRDQGLGGPPVELTVRAGEIAHHWRSTLDHLVYGLVKKSGARPSGKTGFPIFHDAAAFAKRSPGMTNGAPPLAVAIIETLQPFHADSPDEAPLSILQRLNNTDKHRLIPVTVIAGGWLIVRVPDANDVFVVQAIPAVQVADGMELGRVTLPLPNVCVEPWFFANVAFAELGTANDVAMSPSLTAVEKHVTGIVEMLAPEL